MYRVVKIGDVDVPMLSMASVDIYYRHIFHEDPIAMQTGDVGEAGAIDLFLKMGFVMAKFAELKTRKGMLQLNEDAFLDWLDGFERGAYYEALPEIRAVYEGQTESTSDAKKKDGEPSEE